MDAGKGTLTLESSKADAELTICSFKNSRQANIGSKNAFIDCNDGEIKPAPVMRPVKLPTVTALPPLEDKK